MTRRPAPLLSVASLVLLALVGCSDADAPATSTPQATATTTQDGAAEAEQSAAAAAAAWLVTATDGASIVQTEFDGTSYDDYGLTADVTLALLATGDSASASTFATALAAPEAVTAYVGDGSTVQYAAQTGKLVATLETAGTDTSDLDGRDLVSELAALQAESGRFSDLGAEDYSSTISQSWALIALATTAEAPQAGIDYLTAQQCAGAGFPAALSEEAPADCVSDVESTAFAVSALLESGTAADAPVVTEAVAWLESAASSDDAGTFWTTTGTEDANVNSTALAAVALVDAGQDVAGATTWLESQMVADGPDAGAFTLAGEPDLRASAQATLALAGTGFLALLG